MNMPITRKKSLLALTVAAVIATSGCNQDAETGGTPTGEVELDTLEKQVTYVVGYNMASQAKANGLSFEQDVMVQALSDVSADREPRIPEAEQQQIMMSFQEQQQSEREARLQEEGAANLAKSEEFLAETAQRDGVQVTESGLQYEIVEEGEEGAPSPTAEDVVRVHYHGTLIDGTVFDSSVDRGEPVSFPVGGVIDGWVEALQLMSVGDKYILYIPPALAYGEGGTAGAIGPNEALIFEVELLEINPEMGGHHGH